jgi:hypothetical protein
MAKSTTTVIDASEYGYKTLRLRGKDGKLYYMKSNGDAVARALALHTIVNGKDVQQVVRANKIELGKHTNVGQERMALGNSLRAMVKNGEPVTIGTVTVKTLKQSVALPEEKEGAKPAKKAKKATKKSKVSRRKAVTTMADAEATA